MQSKIWVQMACWWPYQEPWMLPSHSIFLHMGMEWGNENSIGNDWTWLGPMIPNCVLSVGECYQNSHWNLSPNGLLVTLPGAMNASKPCNLLHMRMEWGKQNSIGNDWAWLGPMIPNCLLSVGEYCQKLHWNLPPNGLLVTVPGAMNASKSCNMQSSSYGYGMRQTKLHWQWLGMVGSHDPKLCAFNIRWIFLKHVRNAE